MVNSPVPKIPVSNTCVPAPFAKPVVVLHSIPRVVTSLQFAEAIEAPNVAVVVVMAVEVGVFTVGTPAAIPLPETATFWLEAPPPPTTMLPLYATAATGEN